MKWLRTLALSLAVIVIGVASASAASTPKTDAAAAKAALGAVGAPYVWNGASPSTGFDSSGLVVWAYSQAGVRGLPHFSGDLWSRGKHVARKALRPGDLVFFNHASHVGIYIGHGEFVHAPSTGHPVAISPLVAKGYTGAVRI
jgi:cell wall-associated NlpC family hydrolase